jgi:DNA-binding response OmpR family regulator
MPQYLRVYINQLRQKLESDPTWPQYILTDPRVGYRFRGDPATLLLYQKGSFLVRGR